MLRVSVVLRRNALRTDALTLYSANAHLHASHSSYTIFKNSRMVFNSPNELTTAQLMFESPPGNSQATDDCVYACAALIDSHARSTCPAEECPRPAAFTDKHQMIAHVFFPCRAYDERTVSYSSRAWSVFTLGLGVWTASFEAVCGRRHALHIYEYS